MMTMITMTMMTEVHTSLFCVKRSSDLVVFGPLPPLPPQTTTHHIASRHITAHRDTSEAYRDLTVKTVVIPSGDKPSCVSDAPEDYPKDTSPDKV